MQYVLQEPRAVVRFRSLDELDLALNIFSADPVIDIALLPKSNLVLDHTTVELHMPDLANARVQALLNRFDVPFTWHTLR